MIGGRAFHADLPEYVRDQRAFWLDCDKPVVNKSNGFHGTHVAGIIGAKNDGRGPYGVLPGEISCCVAKKAAVETWTAASALLVPSARARVMWRAPHDFPPLPILHIDKQVSRSLRPTFSEGGTMIYLGVSTKDRSTRQTHSGRSRRCAT